MGSPVSPVVADIFMEDFEQKALDTAPAKPKMYKRYVDDTFAVLPNDKVSAFLDHLNSISSNIKFTMELEANNKLAFLDVLILRNPDNTLVLQRNQLKTPHQSHKGPKPPSVERCPATLPYIKGVTDRIGHILRRASIKTYFKPQKKINQFLRPVKCNIPLQDAGVYKLDCELKEHIADMKHTRSTKSAISEHTLDKPNHYIRFDNPQVLAKENRFIPRMMREAIEIKKHPNFNREDGWQVPPVWDPIIKTIKTQSQQKPAARPQDTTTKGIWINLQV
ncbi:hypothetical protein K1T71_013199 [Dendrolimus kikuchii]|uniref:Uncharacterized protein n=1 Tax=Dendrolimus kikuchii TaxID=765133 RepID=A0ACC1CHD9_9NEOP|nr:hypothetical protein K1T71_013199 [Dendrolimus kikuchii]